MEKAQVGWIFTWTKKRKMGKFDYIVAIGQPDQWKSGDNLEMCIFALYGAG